MKRAMMVGIVAGLVGILGWRLMPFPWGHTAEPQKTANPMNDKFGEDRDPDKHKPIAFNADRAMGYLTELCKIGPRLSGSVGMKQQQKMIRDHFEKLGAKVIMQEFQGKQPSQREAVPMVNMIIRWHPERKARVIFCGHYDTRPYADQEPARANWGKPFVSANDGTSTTAFLMEFGHHMKELPMNVGMDFVIFDGEEYIFEKERDRYFLGSEYFAKSVKEDKSGIQYRAAILLDLFAGKNAKIKVEPGSHFFAGGLIQQVWDIATEQKCTAFVWEMGPAVDDDHVALNRIGIPSIDLIDFSYAHWHKLSDLPENCSGETMAQVAKVLNIWLQIQP